MARDWNTPGWDVISYRQRIEKGEAVNLYKREGKRQWNKKLIDEFSRVTYVFKPDGRLSRFSDDFLVSVTIGIDTGDVHVSPEGDSIPYYQLIATLNFFGFDPLYASKSDKALNELSKKATSIFFRANSANNINIGSVRMMFAMGLARIASEYAKDYVRGKTSMPKPELDPDTITTRKYKQNKNPNLYQGKSGINEALWESGQLEEAIHVMDVSVTGSLSKRTRPTFAGYGASNKPSMFDPEMERKRIESIFRRTMLNPGIIEDNNKRIIAARDALDQFHVMESIMLDKYAKLNKKEKTEKMMEWWNEYRKVNPGNIEALRSAVRILGIGKLTFNIR